MKLLEPQLELELYDSEHVVIRVLDHPTERLELVLEDAALRALGQRRVSLRFEEFAEARR